MIIAATRSLYSSVRKRPETTHGTLLRACTGALIGLIICCSNVSAQTPASFYTVDGQNILDGSGNEIVMKGIGLGGWLMPEGYMLHIAAPDGGSPRTIRSQIEDLIGPADTETFFDLYREHYVAEKDIAQIAAWGFDHIRLPFHFDVLYDINTGNFKEEGFTLIDTFLEWCRTHNIGVILDMHATPGAQNSLNISDSDGVARLWTQPVPYQDQTVDIWIEIARRYANEPLIIGYDLINEPVTPDGYPGSSFRNLYIRLTNAIRAVDPNHILFIEGNFFATHFPDLEPPFDDNMVYAFHKYWNGTQTNSINYLLDIRRFNDRPLWLGETGENSNSWFYAVRNLMETNEIGWNWWTHKKIETTTSPLSAPFAPGYEAVLDYWRGNGPRPSAADARSALFAMAEGLDIDSCVVRPGVLSSLFDDSFGSSQRAFADNVIPGMIPAPNYDIGNQGVSYFDNGHAATTGSPGGGNNGASYRNDGVDIAKTNDRFGFNHYVGWVEEGEWMEYTVDIDTEGRYDIDFRVASAVGGGRLRLLLDGVQIGDDVEIFDTGGWENWISTWLRDISLPEGRHLLKVEVVNQGFNINSMVFELVEPANPELPSESPFSARILDHFPSPANDQVNVRFEAEVDVEARFRLFDTAGREVITHSAGSLAAGRNALTFDLNLVSGLYLMELELTGTVGTRRLREKLVILRQRQ